MVAKFPILNKPVNYLLYWISSFFCGLKVNMDKRLPNIDITHRKSIGQYFKVTFSENAKGK